MTPPTFVCDHCDQECSGPPYVCLAYGHPVQRFCSIACAESDAEDQWTAEQARSLR